MRNWGDRKKWGRQINVEVGGNRGEGEGGIVCMEVRNRNRREGREREVKGLRSVGKGGEGVDWEGKKGRGYEERGVEDLGGRGNG